MLSNDTSKRLMIRFKKSKDFNKTIMKLQSEGFDTIITYIKNKRYLKVLKDGKEVLYMIYEDIDDFKLDEDYEYIKNNNKEYQQRIIAIYY